MDNAELIKSLEEKMVNLNPNYKSDCEHYLLEILDFLKENNITFDENTIIGLGSHIFALVGRIKEKEEMMDLGDDAMSEIDENTYKLAKQITEMIEKEANVKLVKSETLLIAIHIQNAITNL